MRFALVKQILFQKLKEKEELFFCATYLATVSKQLKAAGEALSKRVPGFIFFVLVAFASRGVCAAEGNLSISNTAEALRLNGRGCKRGPNQTPPRTRSGLAQEPPRSPSRRSLKAAARTSRRQDDAGATAATIGLLPPHWVAQRCAARGQRPDRGG